MKTVYVMIAWFEHKYLIGNAQIPPKISTYAIRMKQGIRVPWLMKNEK